MCRKNYTAYSETPMKGNSMNVNPKLLKLAVKAALTIGFSILISTTIKVEKQTSERIDAYFDKPKSTEDTED
jgi:hypothetical protein